MIPSKRWSNPLTQILTFAAILAAWYALQRWILPRMGFQT